MKPSVLWLWVIVILASTAGAAEVEILSYGEGDLDFTIKGSGTVAVTAQADVKYLSAKTGTEAMARAVSNPLRISLSETPLPVEIKFDTPDGSVMEVEITIFIDGAEKVRRTFYF